MKPGERWTDRRNKRERLREIFNDVIDEKLNAYIPHFS